MVVSVKPFWIGMGGVAEPAPIASGASYAFIIECRAFPSWS